MIFYKAVGLVAQGCSVRTWETEVGGGQKFAASLGEH